MEVFPCSSMVEQEAVNFEVASSSLAGGAKLDAQPPLCVQFCWSSSTVLPRLGPSVRVKAGEPK